MSSQQPERVFPGAPSPAAGPTGGGKIGVGRLKVGKKSAAWAGVGVVVLLGLLAARGSSSSDSADSTVDPAELDTTETDLYNELQPELENIADQIGDLRNQPRPQKPKKPKKQTGPKGNKPGPKKGKGKPGKNSRYVIVPGDTLGSIAKAKKVRGGRARLFAVNRQTLNAAARAHGKRNSGGGRHLFPGTVILIP